MEVMFWFIGAYEPMFNWILSRYFISILFSKVFGMSENLVHANQETAITMNGVFKQIANELKKHK
jgi:hypothetical protein